jgi:hypothetical protein
MLYAIPGYFCENDLTVQRRCRADLSLIGHAVGEDGSYTKYCLSWAAYHVESVPGNEVILMRRACHRFVSLLLSEFSVVLEKAK